MNTWPVRMGVVIPLANEEATVDELLARVLAQLELTDRLFCVVDRVSRDQTRARIEQAALQDSRVCLEWAPQCRHVVDAYFCGYRAALSAGCRWILEMDGGLSHLPEQIPRFIAAMQTGIDYAPGSRLIPGGEYHGRWTRRSLSQLGSWLARWVLKLRMRDCTSGFECFTAQALQHVVEQGVLSSGHFFQTEIRLLLHDWNWQEVPISYTSPSRRVGLKTVLDAVSCLAKRRSQLDTRSP